MLIAYAIGGFLEVIRMCSKAKSDLVLRITFEELKTKINTYQPDLTTHTNVL